MKMKNLIILFVAIVLMTSFMSCDNSDDSDLLGNWIERSNFEGDNRSSAVVFTIDDFAYVGTGYDGTDYYKDFWQYDAERDSWFQKASMPAEAPERSSAVAFSAGGLGYVGTGFDGDDELKDFWAYDPVANTWDSIAEFAGSARYGAISFSINGIGYIGAGFDGSDRKDIWSYNPTTDTWAQRTSLGGAKRVDALAFVIDGIAYVGTGRNNGLYEFDFWAYDPETDRWDERQELDDEDDYDIARHGGVAFVVDNKGYVATGSNGGLTTTVWEYDPVEDIWEEKTEFDGSRRLDAVGFNVSNRGFVVTGVNGSSRFDDIWELQPLLEDDEDDDDDE